MEGLLSSSTPAGAASRTRVPSTMPSPLTTDWGALLLGSDAGWPVFVGSVQTASDQPPFSSAWLDWLA